MRFVPICILVVMIAAVHAFAGEWTEDSFDAFRDVMRQACMPCWTSRTGIVSAADIVKAIETAPNIIPEQRNALLEVARS